MRSKSREYWIPILLAIPIGIIVNIITSKLDVRLAIIVAILTAIIIGYLLLSDKLINLLNESNRQNKLKKAKQLSDEIEELGKLRNDLPRLLTRITWDLARLFIISSLLIIMVLIIVIIIQKSVSNVLLPIVFPLFIIILYGVLFFYTFELRRIRYIRNIYRYEEYVQETEKRIVAVNKRNYKDKFSNLWDRR